MIPGVIVRQFCQLSVKCFLPVRCVSTLTSNYVTVKDKSIHYIRTGKGPHPLLLLPGALGAAESDFKPQLENLSKDEFTLIGWDPPGYGKSQPPARSFDNFFVEDALMALETMQLLGFSRFSMLGWSDGGITALIAAARKPEAINKMVVFGSNAFIDKTDIDMVEQVRDISAWSERMKQPMFEMYGPEFPALWEAWCDAYLKIFTDGGDICSKDLDRVTCPTLIIYGAKDAMVNPIHVDHLRDNIKGAKSFTFPDGKHNLHFKYQREFNKMVEEFLLNN